ncbi:MAG: MFS transporter [Hyphomicrobiaceae bacterium]|nr:MFS transporter [Hyphomicrobiaceae bacterium]
MKEAIVEAPETVVPLRAIVLLAGAAFASSINLRVCDPLLPQIALDFSATIGQASAIVTGFTVGYGLLQLLFGPVGDRYGKYRVAALTSIAAGLATAFSATSPTLDGLVATRFVAGAFAAAAIPLAFAWIGDVVPFAGRQPVLARFLSAQISGIVLGQAAGGFLGETLGWRAVFVVVGVCHVLAGAAMLLELLLNPSAQPPIAMRRLRIGELAATFVAILARPWVRVMLAAVFVEAFAFYGAFAYVGADLHHRFGIGFALVGALMAAFGIGAIAYAWSARRLLAWLTERGLVLGGGALMSASYVAVAFLPAIAPIPLVMVTLGLGFYMLHNTLQTSATQMAPDARGLGVSLFALALFLGQALGVALAAPVVDRWGPRAVYLAAALVLPFVAVWFRSRLAIRPAA